VVLIYRSHFQQVFENILQVFDFESTGKACSLATKNVIHFHYKIFCFEDETVFANNLTNEKGIQILPPFAWTTCWNPTVLIYNTSIFITLQVAL
jgi:hypothetical protein